MRSRLRRMVALGGGSLLTMTLSACYGIAVDYCRDSADDTDADGYCLAYDCDETNASVHDFAFDTPDDGIDQDCDGRDATGSDGGSDGGSSVDASMGDDAGPTEDGGMSIDDGGMSTDDGGTTEDAGAATDAGM